ncbi:MAG: hypothetical protein AAFX39_12000 [Pseudomonadota bacterium]
MGRTVRDVTLLLPEGEDRAVFGDARLWCLYRGNAVGPCFLTSCLMALESHLLQRAEAGDDLREVAEKILSETNSVVLIAPLASVALKAPAALGEYALTLCTDAALLK